MLLALAGALAANRAAAQSAQVGAAADEAARSDLQIVAVQYRPARYETAAVVEPDNGNPNEGGLIHAYLRNVADEPLELKFWRLNDRDESHYRVDRRVVWDRLWQARLEPGRMTVLEINGFSADFAPGRPFRFSYVDGSWTPAGSVAVALEEDPLRMALVRVLPGLREIEVFFRHEGTGAVEFGGIEVVGKSARDVRWTARTLAGPGVTIARLALAEPLSSGELLILAAEASDARGPRTIYGHRRAFADAFPLGTWTGHEPLRAELHGLHIDAVVHGGPASDAFFASDAERFGLRAMVPTGVVTNVDQIRQVQGHPGVACWMLHDEPDWATPATQVLLADQTVRQHDATTPTMVTLCRNVKFFEYAPIVDIACMDHYCVTAPSSSAWPHPWGTRLEETAYYTRDLKAAAEPKPVWVWTQGLADWDERPQRPVPTVEELSAQAVLNVSRGAKGLLWFNYDAQLGAKYPEVRDAIGDWNRAFALVRDDLLGSEPAPVVLAAPPDIDARLLVGADSAVLCLVNLDYQISPAAYPFAERRDLEIACALPPWLRPAAAARVDRHGPAPVGLRGLADGRYVVAVDRLVDAALILLPAAGDPTARLQAAWRAAERPAATAPQP